MNDSKNLILAVVLSALVLLGWTWAANKYFPTANPPSTKVENGKQKPLPQPQAQPTADRTESAQGAQRGAGFDPAREDPDARRFRARSTSRARRSTTSCWSASARRSPRIRRRCACCRRSARPAPMSPRSAGPARASVPSLDTMWTADSQLLAPGHPVTLTTQSPDGARYQIKIVGR